jgi:hypothetical protein
MWVKLVDEKEYHTEYKQGDETLTHPYSTTDVIILTTKSEPFPA